MTGVVKIDCVLTDTFAGEANFSSVKRREIVLPEAGLTRLKIMRAAKAALGLSGVEGKTTVVQGDTYEFRPRRACMIAFVTVTDEVTP